MERLTKYDEFGNAELVGIDNTKLYERLVCDETVALTTAIDKLGKLEDVLEEFELTSAEDLRNHLNFQDNMAIWEGELNYKNKIADLEQQLAKLKQKAIVPKFGLGQPCFIIWIDGVMLFHIEKIIMELSKDEEETSVDYLITNHYGYALTFPEEEIFATKEEAEQKLAEIGGKDE